MFPSDDTATFDDMEYNSFNFWKKQDQNVNLDDIFID